MSGNIAIIYDNNNCFTRYLANYIQSGVKTENINSIMYEAEFIINNLKLLDGSQAIILGTPTHFGNVSYNIKKFMDATNEIWDSRKWSNKIAAGFTHSSGLNGDKLSALMSIFIFAQQHGMIWVGLDLKSNAKIDNDNTKLNKCGSWMGFMAEPPKQSQNNTSNKKTAEYFGARVAKLTKMFHYN